MTKSYIIIFFILLSAIHTNAIYAGEVYFTSSPMINVLQADTTDIYFTHRLVLDTDISINFTTTSSMLSLDTTDIYLHEGISSFCNINISTQATDSTRNIYFSHKLGSDISINLTTTSYLDLNTKKNIYITKKKNSADYIICFPDNFKITKKHIASIAALYIFKLD